MSLPPLTPELIELDSDYPGLDIDEMVRAYGEACAVAERERCAQICEDRAKAHWLNYKQGELHIRGSAISELSSDEADECAAAIRSAKQ